MTELVSLQTDIHFQLNHNHTHIHMKKLILLILIFVAFQVKAQQNYWPSAIAPGSTSFSPTFRWITGVTDSLNDFTLAIGTKSYRFYSSVKANSLFIQKSRTISTNSATGLYGGGNLVSNLSLYNDTTKLQTVANLYPISDLRYFSKAASDARYGRLSGGNTWGTGIQYFNDRLESTGYWSIYQNGNANFNTTTLGDNSYLGNSPKIGNTTSAAVILKFQGYYTSGSPVYNWDFKSSSTDFKFEYNGVSIWKGKTDGKLYDGSDNRYLTTLDGAGYGTLSQQNTNISNIASNYAAIGLKQPRILPSFTPNSSGVIAAGDSVQRALEKAQYQINTKPDITVSTITVSDTTALKSLVRGNITQTYITDPRTSGTFKYYASGYTVDGGTVFSAMGGGFWVRQFSASINAQWYGAIPDSVTDNYAAFKKCLNSYLLTAKVIQKIIIPTGNYICSQSLVPTAVVYINGSDGSDMYPNIGSPTKIIFPAGQHGISLTNSNCQGSVIQGIDIVGPGFQAGKILEYNSSSGTLLYQQVAGANPITANTFDSRDPFSPDVIKGTFTYDGTTPIVITKMVQFVPTAGSFTVGETITGGTSGATAVVRFVSQIFNNVAVNSVSGAFTVGETITGGTSGATATYSSRNATLSGFVFLVPVTTVTGTINAINNVGDRINTFNKSGGIYSGIFAKYRHTAIDVNVTGFSGNGITIGASTTGYVGNANACRYLRVKTVVNGLNGLYLVGGDVNVGDFAGINTQYNNGYAIVNNSFLGNTFDYPYSNVNLCGGFVSFGVNNKSLFNNPYTEYGYTNSPYAALTSTIAGGSHVIGGVAGLALNTWDYPSNQGQRGSQLDQERISNRRMRTELNNPLNGTSVIFGQGSGAGTDGFVTPLQVEASGGGGGSGIGFNQLYNAGTMGNGQLVQTTWKTAEIYGTLSSGKAALQSVVARNPPIACTITGSGGSGANVYASVLGGVVISVRVGSEGINYPLNTTITAGGGSVLTPTIIDGSIVSVAITNAGTGLANNDLFVVDETVSTGFRPFFDNSYNLGESAKRWLNIYGTIGTFGSIANTNLGTPTAIVLTNATGLPTAGLVNNAVTYAKMQAVTTNKLLGSGTGTSVAEITLGTGLSFTGTTLNATGLTNPMTTAGDVIYGGTAGVPTRLTASTGTTVLHSGTTPSWGAVSLTSDVSGLLPIANGGTGSSTKPFVDLTTSQTLAGNKTFTNAPEFKDVLYIEAASGLYFDIGGLSFADHLVHSDTGSGDVKMPNASGTMGLRIKPYTVATLPTAVVGDTAYVTDATAPTYLGVLVGGGTVKTPVFYDGVSWKSY
jgi:hypothetical protein